LIRRQLGIDRPISQRGRDLAGGCFDRGRQAAGVEQIIPVVDHDGAVIQPRGQLRHRGTDVPGAGDEQRRCRLDVHPILDQSALMRDLQRKASPLLLTDPVDGMAERSGL